MLKGVLRGLSSRLDFKPDSDSLMDQIRSISTYRVLSTGLKAEQITCLMMSHGFNMSWNLGFKRQILDLGHMIVTKCILFHFTEIGLSVARKLAAYYSSEGEIELHDKYRSITASLMEVLNHEIEAEGVFARLCVIHRSGHSIDPAIKNDLNSLSEKAGKLNSFKFHVNYYYSKYILHDKDGDYEKSVMSALKAYRFFESLEFDHQEAKHLFVVLAIDQILTHGMQKNIDRYLDIVYEDSDHKLVDIAKQVVKEKLALRAIKIA